MDRRFALGVGLTNACNLSCRHCYRGAGADQLSASEVLRAVDALPTRAVNFGTGENGLHPEFARIVGALLDRGLAVTFTTNGYSAAVLPDEILRRVADVEFSIDHPSEEAHDGARGAGNWKLIEEQMARCRALGVPTAIVTVMMSSNYLALPALARLAAGRGAVLRVNVYQAVRSDLFRLGYRQFWDGWRALLEVADIETCGEPILRAVLGMPKAPGAGCGAQTVRVTPRGAVLPCVYGADDALSMDDLAELGPRVVDDASFTRLGKVPASCRGCPQVATCGGGCASRRQLAGGLDRPDEYCPFVRGESIALSAQQTDAARLRSKAASACTTIVRLREGGVPCA